MTSQQWWNDMRVLTQESDIRRLRPTDQRVIRVVPAPAAPTWGDVSHDPTSRAILAHLTRLGFENTGVIDGKAYLLLAVEPRPLLVVLTLDENDPEVIDRLTYGRVTLTAEQAARWLAGL